MQNGTKINQLERELPEGLVADAAWLSARGYSTSLRSQYVAAGWLEQPARRVYRRPRGELSWRQVVVSLQALLRYRLVVGGRTALELQGYAHYLSQGELDVHLYGPENPPGWLASLDVGTRFAYRNSTPLFGGDLERLAFPTLDDDDNARASFEKALAMEGLRVSPWGQWNWPLVHSAPERAVLELLDELPQHESFHQADMLMEGLVDLSPRRMQRLLERCRSVKTKRLFFFFADRHGHAWLKHLDRKRIDFGSGKRMLVKGGAYDSRYQITVPKELMESA